jgi:hypothetical protein
MFERQTAMAEADRRKTELESSLGEAQEQVVELEYHIAHLTYADVC